VFALRSKEKYRPAMLGAAAGLVGVLGARYGAQWEAQNPLSGLMSGGASGGSTPAGASSSGGASTGYGGNMSPRMMSPGGYGARQNPYAQHFAGARRK
jgi:hypothetical protein